MAHKDGMKPYSHQLVKPYDVMVYIEDGRVYAIDKFGEVVAKGDAGTDDTTVIQTAIDSSSGKIFVKYGTYIINSTIIVKENADLEFEYNTIVKPSADVDVFYMKKGTRISGCKIDVRDVTNYSSSCIMLNGAEKYSAATNNNLSAEVNNIVFINNAYTGKAIHLYSAEVTSGYIWGVSISDIHIYKFEYGIRLYRTGEYSVNWINGNFFRNIHATTTRKLFYMESSTGVGSDLDGNFITNINMQSFSQNCAAIKCLGRYNIFKNVMVWDWLSEWSVPIFEFDVNSNLNYVELDSSNETFYVNNGGTSNKALFTMLGKFVGIVKAPTAEYGTSTTQLATTEYVMNRVSPSVVTVGASKCDYTSLYSALANVGDRTSETRCTIYVYGYVTETTTASIDFRSYVKVVGIGNACVEINNNTSNNSFRVVNKSNVDIENITLIRSGTPTSGGSCLAMSGLNDTVTLRNCTIINNEQNVAIDLHGSYIDTTSNLLIEGCTFIGGGTETTTCTGYGLYITIRSNGVIRNSKFISGTGNSTFGAYLSNYASFDVSNCIFTYKRLSGSFIYTGGASSFVPSSSLPVCLEREHTIYISVAGEAGSTIKIGTTAGGNEIGTVTSASTGYKFASPYNLVNLNAGDTIYLTPSDTNTRFKYYYEFGYNTNATALAVNSTALSNFRNCTMLSPPASTSALYIYVGANSSKFINCNIYSRGTYDVSSNTDNVTLYAYGCTFNSGTFYNVIAMPDNSNNNGLPIPSEGFNKSVASQLMDMLGSPKLICSFSNRSSTSVSDYTRNSNTLTSSVTLSGSWIGVVGYSNYYNFNGSSHYLYRTNDTDFDFGNATTDSAFSVVCCLNPDAVDTRFLIGKWDENNLREWRLFLDASGYPTFQLYDESADTYIGRVDSASFGTGTWKVLIATYDGSGISAGCKLYIDGVQVDDADYASGTYVAMEAVSAYLMVGAKKNSTTYSEYYDGKMTWIGIAAKELSADEVWSLTQRLKGVLGV